ATRRAQRRFDLLAEIDRGRQFVSIAKERRQSRGQLRTLGDDAFRNAVRLDGSVQPARPALVDVAVTNEGFVGELRGRHASLHKPSFYVSVFVVESPPSSGGLMYTRAHATAPYAQTHTVTFAR